MHAAREYDGRYDNLLYLYEFMHRTFHAWSFTTRPSVPYSIKQAAVHKTDHSNNDDAVVAVVDDDDDVIGVLADKLNEMDK